MKINDQKIKFLIKSGESKRTSVGNGLYLRVANRVGYWVVRYTVYKKRKEISIGKYPEISLANAMLEALQIKQGLKENIDPQAEKKRGSMAALNTVDDLAADWLNDCDKRLKHPGIPRRVYEKDIGILIGELGVSDVGPRDIRAIIVRIFESGRPSVSNDALAYCKQLFSHAIKLDLRESNPADAFSVTDAGGVEKSRKRTLSFKEVECVFNCLLEYKAQFARENFLAVALLLVLGVRKGELIAAKWSEFDLASSLWELPDERSKMGAGMSIPLPSEAVVWLEELKIRSCESEYVFPSRRASKRQHMSHDTLNAALQKLFDQGKMPIPHFTVHDFRRTFRSLLAELKVPGHIAERCLNHKLKGVEGIYDRYDYFEERKEALARLSGLIGKAVNKVSIRENKGLTKK